MVYRVQQREEDMNYDKWYVPFGITSMFICLDGVWTRRDVITGEIVLVDEGSKPYAPLDYRDIRRLAPADYGR